MGDTLNHMPSIQPAKTRIPCAMCATTLLLPPTARSVARPRSATYRRRNHPGYTPRTAGPPGAAYQPANPARPKNTYLACKVCNLHRNKVVDPVCRTRHLAPSRSPERHEHVKTTDHGPPTTNQKRAICAISTAYKLQRSQPPSRHRDPALPRPLNP